jgi:sigma-B regulation protein RsbU (phosphoserine phosphatase)
MRVLLCDDQPDVLQALQLMLKGAGYQTHSVNSPDTLLEQTRQQHFDVIVADLNYSRDTTSGAEGLALLAALEAQGNQTPVVVMTAWGSIDLAVEAMRLGASDFIQKPWDNAQALAVIRRQATLESRRRSELEIAASVQRTLFPNTPHALCNLDYAGQCVAARGIGGDYYDFLDLEPGHLAVLLGDVSGKGVPAALLMANLQACFRSQSAAALRDPTRLLSGIHDHFYASTTADRFVTLFFGVYDDTTRRLRYLNCGHCPPLLRRASGAVQQLHPNAPILGAFAKWSCEEAEVTFSPGDTLLLYSDGVTEAANAEDEMFGEERLRALLDSSGPATNLVQDVATAVSQFSCGIPSDDITIVALRAR